MLQTKKNNLEEIPGQGGRNKQEIKEKETKVILLTATQRDDILTLSINNGLL